jgi:hypothetical protein
MPDRNLGLRLPEVELADLARAVDGALVGALGDEERAHLAQVVVEDRLAAGVAELGDQLADAGGGDAVVGAQEALDLLLEGIELGGPRPSLIARRLLGAQRRSHRVASQARPSRDLLDRDPVDHVHPPDLRPLLHVQHTLPPGSASLVKSGSGSPRTLSPPLAGVSIRPARGGQYSGGAYTSTPAPLATGVCGVPEPPTPPPHHW